MMTRLSDSGGKKESATVHGSVLMLKGFFSHFLRISNFLFHFTEESPFFTTPGELSFTNLNESGGGGGGCGNGGGGGSFGGGGVSKQLHPSAKSSSVSGPRVEILNSSFSSTSSSRLRPPPPPSFFSSAATSAFDEGGGGGGVEEEEDEEEEESAPPRGWLPTSPLGSPFKNIAPLPPVSPSMSTISLYVAFKILYFFYYNTYEL